MQGTLASDFAQLIAYESLAKPSVSGFECTLRHIAELTSLDRIDPNFVNVTPAVRTRQLHNTEDFVRPAPGM